MKFFNISNVWVGAVNETCNATENATWMATEKETVNVVWNTTWLATYNAMWDAMSEILYD